MSVFLWTALIIAVTSVLVAGSILAFGLGLFGYYIVPTGVTYEAVNSVASLSAAISTIFALIVGTIAILAVIIAERAETRTVEQLKIDISSVWMTLHTLRNRSILYTNPTLIPQGADLFDVERERLLQIVAGASGFALYLWQAETENEELSDLTSDIAGLVDLTTLSLEPNATPVLNAIAHRADEISTRIAAVSDADLRRMARHLARLGAGLDQARDIASRDKISRFLEDWRISEQDELEFPTEAFVNRILIAARDKIGGKVDETIMHLLNNARAGDRKALQQFYQLIRRLQLIDDSETVKD